MTDRTRSCRTSPNRPRPTKRMQAPTFGREAGLARGAAGRHAGAGEPGAAGRVDDSDFPRSEFRSGRRSEFRARGRSGIGGRLSRRPPRPLRRCKQTRRQPHRRRRSGRRPRAPRPLPLAARRRLAPARRSTAPKKVHTVIIRTDQMGPTTPMRRPRRRLSGSCTCAGARADSAASRRHAAAPRPQPRRALRPMARCRSFPIRAALRRAGACADPHGAGASDRTQPGRASRAGAIGRPAAAMPFKSRPSAARLRLRRSSGRCGPNFPPSSAAASRSSAAPILAPKASITARWSAPLLRLEQAAGMCSSLKAAGGSCIVQRN